MPKYTVLALFEAARGRGAMLLRDVRRPGVFAVSITQDRKSQGVRESDEVQAVEQFNALWLDVRGHTSWNAVLDRLMGRAQPYCEWEGSPGQWAERYAPVGTELWVELLVQLRKSNLEAGRPEGAVPQL